MKKYYELSSHQQDKAVDKAMEILMKMILDTEFDYTFKSPIAQNHFHSAILCDPVYFQNVPSNRIRGIDIMIHSDEIIEELTPTAEMMAEIAYYPGIDEYVIQGVINQK
jgi:hypothetical protein